MSELAVIATFSFPHEAQLARSKLEAFDIPAFVLDEHTINMHWLYSDALGGVKLAVPRSQVENALQLLQEDAALEELDEPLLACAHCGSHHLYTSTQGKKPAFIVFLLLGFPLFFYKRGLRCEDCGGFTPL
jgi:DNA-directed RNA polymerase subunit RPC12/RpoP